MREKLESLPLATLKEFAKEKGIKIEKEIYFTNGLQKSKRNGLFRANKHIANFFSSDAIFVIEK